MTDSHVRDWLLDSDSSIRWQVLRDLTDAPQAEIAAERERMEHHGWCAALLTAQNADGSWGDGIARATWESTLYTWQLLRLMGLDPTGVRAQRAMQRTRDGFSWGAEFGNTMFLEGETEPCINGGVLAIGAYFGEPNAALLARLLGEQLDDGGWNCNAPRSSVASFHTTICVLEGLAAYEKAVGVSTTISAARARGEQYLLERRLFRRRSTGAIVDAQWTQFSFPTNWHYDVMRGLEYLRSAGVTPDARMQDAIALVRSAAAPDGTWRLTFPRPAPPRHWDYPINFQMEPGDGMPSRWITLRALRVLRWFDTHH